jgi:hypothetical protein
MAGRNQHYIPQSLLRGFAAQSTRKEVQVYVFHAERQPYLATTRNVAAERDFYSAPSPLEKTLDDKITLYEGKEFEKILNQLRVTESDEIVDPSNAAEIISHLVFRGAHLRGTLLDATQHFSQEFLIRFSDEDKSRSYLGVDHGELEDTLSEELERVVQLIQSTNGQKIPSSLLRHICRFKLREDFSLHWPELAKNLHGAVSEFTGRFPDLIKQAHRNALTTLQINRSIIDELCQLKWVLIRSSNLTFILPDCIAIARCKDMVDYQSLLFCDRQTLEEVLFPISTSMLLVGLREREANDFDPGLFNSAAASCSFKFFVASSNASSVHCLSSLVGSKHNGFTQDVSKDLFETKLKSNTATQATTVESDNNCDAVSFPMHLDGMISETEAHQVADAFNAVLRSIRELYSISIINEVWFTANYEDVLKQLDLGFDSPPIEPGNNSIGLAPIVIRNGKVKCCLVLKNWIGTGLLKSSTDEAFRFSLYAVSKMLMRVALVELIDRQLPSFIHRNAFDARMHYHYRPVADALSSYFSERFASRFCIENDQFHLQAYEAAIANASKVIPAARLAYRINGNLDGLLTVALDSVSGILNTAATLIGYCDAAESDDLLNRINQIDVLIPFQSWLYVFRRDLRHLLDHITRLSSFAQVEQMSIHTERLLWEFGLFSWLTDSGEMYFEVPIASDASALIKMKQEQ